LDQRRLARERRPLLKAAPQAVQADAWITQCPPVGDELASIIILCCNQVEYTRQCLESVLRHTRPPYELVLVDNGSTDGTAEYLAEIGRRLGGPGAAPVGASERRQSIARDVSPWRDHPRGPSPERATVPGCEPDSAALPGLERNDAAVVPGAYAAWLSTAAPPGLRPRLSTAGALGPATSVQIIRNETNVGFPGGCNQGLQRARGKYVVFLNNDTIVTEGWLEGLIRWSLFEWPKVGMVGPVTNFSSQPQQIGVDYQELSGLPGFAGRQRNKFANQAQRVERLTGFCLLVRREVLDKIDGFDERFGLGFFDDDDLWTTNYGPRTTDWRLTVHDRAK
jgi:GT2 family glycosyltransferase